MTQTEQNKSIARRFGQEGWGTEPNWEKIWDELMANDVVHHFNSSPAPIMGLKATKGLPNNKSFQLWLWVIENIDKPFAQIQVLVLHL